MPKIGCSSKYIYSKVKKFDKIKLNAIPKKKNVQSRIFERNE